MWGRDLAGTDGGEAANAVRLCEQWMSHWHEGAVADLATKSRSPLRSCLLLDRWQGNPLAAEIMHKWPVLAELRRAVPDALFENRLDDAPCLVPWPDWFIDEPKQLARFRADFLLWLAAASCDGERRQVPQHFCGIVSTRAPLTGLIEHLRRLGHQTPPSGEPCLFRYQDPRVTQRIWPLFTPSQRQVWMGPITSWWSLTQPWAGWEPSLFQAREPAPAPGAAEWTRMTPPTREELGTSLPHLSIRMMFNWVQWRTAHQIPTGHRVWAHFASQGTPAALQPDGPAMDRLIAAGQREGLSGPSLEDYVVCCWRPSAPLAQREIDWDIPQNHALLKAVLQILREQPTARFGGVMWQVVQGL